jgi:uncharacterized membrane protein YfcA
MEFNLLGFVPAAVFATFAGLLFGGLSKGALGVGLPLIATPFLSLAMSVPQALVVLTMPIITTNIYQALQGGNLRAAVQRFWPMAVALSLGIVIGAQILARLDSKTLYLIMGLIVMIQPVLRLVRPDAIITGTTQRWLEPAVGAFAGVVGGMSGLYGPVLLVYLASLRLQKDFFTTTVAMLFFTGGIVLAAALSQVGVMNYNDLMMSALACIPAFLGIFLGQKIRARINQAQFEKALTVTMFIMGLSLLYKAV